MLKYLEFLFEFLRWNLIVIQMKFKLPVQAPKDFHHSSSFSLSHCLHRPLHLLLTISTIWNNFLIFL